MEFSGLRVFVLGSGKQSLAMIRGLKEIGCYVVVNCGSKKSICYVSNKPDKKLMNEHIKNRDNLAVRDLIEIIKTEKIDVVMPIAEMGTNFATQHEDEIKPYAKLACAPRSAYIKAFNKQITFDTAIEKGIPCSYTRHSKQDIEEYLNTCHFPIIIKPRQGLGSIGFHKFEKREDFWPYMKEHNLNPDDYVVQEFVNFDKHIGCLLFIDQKGNICTSYTVDVLRRFPLDAGSAVMLQTTDEHEVLQYAGKLLQYLGWKGFADVAFMVDKETGEPKLLEINGRIPQSVKMAYMCGFNISRQMLEMAFDEDVIQYPENDKFGLYLRHFDTDLAWFFKSPDRFKVKPSWFSWKNTQEVLYSRDDKRPFYTNLWNQITGFNTKIKKKHH